MPTLKVRTGRLAPDQEALDYYNTPARHWTNRRWDEIDMDRVDIGIHMDATPTGRQAAERREYQRSSPEGLGADDTKDLRFRLDPDRMMDMEDLGTWDDPSTVIDALMPRFPERRAELGQLRALDRPQAFTGMRKILDEEGVDTIRYVNEGEGVAGIEDEFFESGEYQKLQDEILNDPDVDPDEAPYILDEEVERILDERRGANESYIALNPGNVRSADAAFSKENIGKAGMLLGAGGLGVGLAGGSSQAEAGPLQLKEFLNLPKEARRQRTLDEGGFTEADLEAWRRENKVQGNKRTPPPELQSMAQQVKDGTLPYEDYRAFLMENYPPTMFDQPPELVPPIAMAAAPPGGKALDKGIVGVSTSVPDGTRVGSRLDIPAYNEYDTWVETMHAAENMPDVLVDGKPVKARAPIGYGQAIKLSNVDFNTFPDAAMKIAAEGKPKAPFAQMNGDYINADPEALRSEMQGEGWVQVGMNPQRSGAFYDKRDMRPLRSADEVIQVGADVRAKNPVYREPNDPELRTKGGAQFGRTTPGFLGTVAAASAIPSTAAYLASQGPSEALSELPQAIGNLGRGIWNDAQEVGRRLHRGLTGTDIGDFGRLDEGQPTGLGGALAEDFGSFDFLPGSGQYTVGQAMGDVADAYNEYVSPYLSTAQEDVLLGGGLAASMLGVSPGTRGIRYGTQDTRLGSQTPAANKRSMENQATQVREALAEEGGYETVVDDAVDLQSLPVLSRSDLEGGVLMPTAGDMTIRAPAMRRASGIEVDTDLQGGPGYGAEFGAWESTDDIARSYQDKVQKVAEASGRDKVFGTYSPMRLPSANFSTMPVEVAMQQMRAMREAGAEFDPAMVRRLDDIVRGSGVKPAGSKVKVYNTDFPGLLSDEATDYLTQKGSLPVAGRKALLEEMGKASYRDAGFPLIDQIYRDVSYPELHGRDIGETGDLLLRLDPSSDVNYDSTHRSYGTVIPGQGAARLGGTIDFPSLYRDPWSQLRGAMTEPKSPTATPRLLNKLEKTNTVNWNKPGGKKARTPGFQLVDDALLDMLEERGLLAP